MKEHPQAYKFRQAYANIPIPLRSQEICCVIDDEPMTFKLVKEEIDKKSEIGYKAIEQLLRLGII